MSSPSLPPSGEIVLYQTEDGRTRVECRLQRRDALALAGADRGAVPKDGAARSTMHLKSIYEEGELTRRQLSGSS